MIIPVKFSIYLVDYLRYSNGLLLCIICINDILKIKISACTESSNFNDNTTILLYEITVDILYYEEN